MKPYFRGKEVIILSGADTSLADELTGTVHSCSISAFSADQVQEGVTPPRTQLTMAPWLDDKNRIIEGELAKYAADGGGIKILPLPGGDAKYLVYSDGVYRYTKKSGLKDIVCQYIPIRLQTDKKITSAANLIEINRRKSVLINSVDIDPNYICFKDFVLNWKTGKLYPHSQKRIFTTQIATDWVRTNTECPTFDKYIRDLCSNDAGEFDQGKHDVIQEYCGLTVSNLNVFQKTKKCLILHSDVGNTGKTQLIHILTALLGGAPNVLSIGIDKLDASYSGSRFALGKLEGKRLIAADDMSGKEIHDCSTFKSLVGGAPIAMEEKGIQAQTIQPVCGMIITCNQPPYFADDKGQHVFDRLILIPTEHHIAEKDVDRDMTQRIIQNELPGVAKWCIEGLRRLEKNGWNLTKCKAAEQALMNLRMTSDTVFRYLSEGGFYTITGKSADRVEKATFDRNYAEWADKEGYPHPVGKVNIGLHIKKIKGCGQLRTHGERWYTGIKAEDNFTILQKG